MRAGRDDGAASRALAAVREQARGEREPAPAVPRGAAHASCTVGEICAVLREEWGVYDSAAPLVRILVVSQMYPGPADPDLGVFVAQLADALAERGHELELAVLDRRAGGKRRYLELRAKVRRAARPDVVWAHFLVPVGLDRLERRCTARRDGARPRRPQRRDAAGRRRAHPPRRQPGDAP